MKTITYCFGIALFLISGTSKAQVFRTNTPQASDSSQASEQHFLWFTGHWSKSKKNTFVTDAYTDSLAGSVIKMGGGTTVTVSPDGGVHIGSNDIDDWNKTIDDGEKNLDKTIKELTDPSNQTQEWAYHFNQAVIPWLDTLKAKWSSYKIDKSENVLNPDHQKEQRLQNLLSKVSAGCKKMQPQYQAIIDFYHAHKNDKPSDYHNPPPPQMGYHCVDCDTVLQHENDRLADDYGNKFGEPEKDMVRTALGILRQLALMGRIKTIDNTLVSAATNNTEVDQLFHRDKSDPSKSGPCAYLDAEELSRAVQFLALRGFGRAKKLLQDNKNNFRVTRPVISTFWGIARQCELMGLPVENSVSQMTPDMAGMLKKAYDYYYNKLVKDHDWSQLSNIPFLLGVARQYALLTGGQQINQGNDVAQLQKILNSFYLQIEMDIKIGKDEGYVIAHLKGKTKIALEFDRANNNCCQWVVTEDQPNNIGEPVKKSSMKINVDVLDNEIIIPKDRPTYIGTKHYWCMLKELKMDYCHAGQDTILLTGFMPDPNVTAGTWAIPYSPPQPMGINGLDHFFQDINKMKELAQSGAAQRQAEIAKGQAQNLIAQMKALKQKMGNRHDTSQIANYQQMMTLASKTQQLFNNSNLSPMLYIDFPLKIQNNSTTLFKKRFEAKEVNPRLANVVVYGYYTVDIEYKPS